MIWIVWRGSGILVLIYFFLSAWLCHYYFDPPHSLANNAYAGWTLFWAALAAGIHALLAMLARKGHDDHDPNAEPPKPWNHSHLFYIPVVFWPVIFGGLACLLLFSSGSSPHNTDYMADVKTDDQVEEKVIKRAVNFLNPTDDTMYYEIGGTGGVYERTKVEPHTFITRMIEPGNFYINGLSYDGDTVFSFPYGKVARNSAKTIMEKNNDDVKVPHRIIGEGTESEKDYDEIWVVLDGEWDILLLDVTTACSATVTEEEIEKTDWAGSAVVYDGKDIVEPLYGKDPGKNSFTVLATGDDIPTSVKKNERVYAMFRIEPGQELTNEYLAGRVKKRCPAFEETK